MDVLIITLIAFLTGAAGYALGVLVTEWSHSADMPPEGD